MAASSNAPATAAIIEFRSVVDAVRCAIEIQNGLIERNAGLPPEAHRVSRRHSSWRRRRGERRRPDGRRGQYRSAARGHRQAGRDLPLGTRLLAGQVAARSRGHRPWRNQLKNIAQPIHVYSLEVGQPAQAKAETTRRRPSRKALELAPLAAAIATSPSGRRRRAG